MTPGSARRTRLLRREGPAGVGVLPAAWASVTAARRAASGRAAHRPAARPANPAISSVVSTDPSRAPAQLDSINEGHLNDHYLIAVPQSSVLDLLRRRRPAGVRSCSGESRNRCLGRGDHGRLRFSTTTRPPGPSRNWIAPTNSVQRHLAPQLLRRSSAPPSVTSSSFRRASRQWSTRRGS